MFETETTTFEAEFVEADAIWRQRSLTGVAVAAAGVGIMLAVKYGPRLYRALRDELRKDAAAAEAVAE